MKYLILSVVLLLVSSFTMSANNLNGEVAESTFLIKSLEDVNAYNDDCGGCIAWADSRDDGSDRTLRQWNRDLASCRANSPECNGDDGPPVLVQI